MNNCLHFIYQSYIKISFIIFFTKWQYDFFRFVLQRSRNEKKNRKQVSSDNFVAKVFTVNIVALYTKPEHYIERNATK